jgi:hypothetical protein
MQRIHAAEHPDLSAHELPGPDTRTKLSALQTEDPRLQLMLREAARVGWPAAYTDDLYRHDKKQLEQHPGEKLLWILREHGTHLYPTECDNSHEVRFCRQVIEYWSGDHKLNYSPHPEGRALYYLVSDSSLEPLTWEEAREALKVSVTSPSGLSPKFD